jgi:hypothetical protein
MKYLITHLFFVIGLLFIGVLIHEFIHYLQCGGDFIAGFYYVKGEVGVGVTYCKNGNASELLAYTVSILFVLPVFIYKMIKDFRG